MLNRLITPLALLAVLASPVLAQDKPAKHVHTDKMAKTDTTAKMGMMAHMTDPPSDLVPLLNQYASWFLKGAEQMPEADYAFKPTPEVRSFGQLAGHMANGNFAICAAIKGEKSPGTADFEKVTDKTALVQALRDAMAYCATVHTWAKERHHDQVNLFGMKGSVTWALAFNIAHNAEHYGNMVTYFRLKGRIPPSSQGG